MEQAKLVGLDLIRAEVSASSHSWRDIEGVGRAAPTWQRVRWRLAAGADVGYART